MDETEENVDNVENKPAVTPEEFAELRSLQAQQTFMQAQGYQIFNFITNLDLQFSQLSEQLNAQMSELTEKYTERINSAKEQLAALEAELSNLSTNFKGRFQTIVSNYGFEDVDSVAIADTEPHFITPVQLSSEQPSE